MVFIRVGGQHIFVLSAEDFISKLLADFMGKLRRYLTDIEGLDHMTGYDPDGLHSFLLGYPSRPFKLLCRRFRCAPVGGDQQLVLGLIGV